MEGSHVEVQEECECRGLFINTQLDNINTQLDNAVNRDEGVLSDVPGAVVTIS